MKNKGSADRRTLWLRLVATALLLYALAHLTAAQLRLARTERLAEALAAERSALAAENAALEERLRSGGSAETL